MAAELFGHEMDGDIPEGVISRVIVIVEVLDLEDSETSLQVLSSCLPPWDAAGMIRGAQIEIDLELTDCWHDAE